MEALLGGRTNGNDTLKGKAGMGDNKEERDKEGLEIKIEEEEGKKRE